MAVEIEPDATLDCRGLYCPEPVIRTAEKIREMRPGEVLEVVGTDPGLVIDIPAYCLSHGHTLMGIEQRDGEIDRPGQPQCPLRDSVVLGRLEQPHRTMGEAAHQHDVPHAKVEVAGNLLGDEGDASCPCPRRHPAQRPPAETHPAGVRLV